MEAPGCPPRPIPAAGKSPLEGESRRSDESFGSVVLSLSGTDRFVVSHRDGRVG